jgi:hypothetical protein
MSLEESVDHFEKMIDLIDKNGAKLQPWRNLYSYIIQVGSNYHVLQQYI